MAFVVCEPCIKCKYTNCVDVCPVACFREGAVMLVIDPDECIDCAVCVDECPVRAIYSEDEVPEKWKDYIDINRIYSKIWPIILIHKEPHPEAEIFRNITDKKSFFDPSPPK